jgi:hypothetical protein
MLRMRVNTTCAFMRINRVSMMDGSSVPSHERAERDRGHLPTIETTPRMNNQKLSYNLYSQQHTPLSRVL